MRLPSAPGRGSPAALRPEEKRSFPRGCPREPRSGRGGGGTGSTSLAPRSGTPARECVGQAAGFSLGVGAEGGLPCGQPSLTVVSCISASKTRRFPGVLKEISDQFQRWLLVSTTSLYTEWHLKLQIFPSLLRFSRESGEVMIFSSQMKWERS